MTEFSAQNENKNIEAQKGIEDVYIRTFGYRRQQQHIKSREEKHSSNSRQSDFSVIVLVFRMHE
jgi:hypothetical protein